MKRTIDDSAILARFEQIVGEAVKERNEDSLSPGIGTKYPHMSNAKNDEVVRPFLYFRTSSGEKRIPQISRMELPAQAFGLIGVKSAIIFDLRHLSEPVDKNTSSYDLQLEYPTHEEYLNYRRDALCLQIKDVLNGIAKSEVIFEKTMQDIANECMLSKLYKVALEADWRNARLREIFLGNLQEFYEALEHAAKERGELELFYFDRPNEWCKKGYSRKHLYIHRLRQLINQIEEN